MPVKSYLAMSHKGQKNQLQNAIGQLSECEVLPSDNKDVLIVVTETSDEKADKKLFKKLNSLPNLQMLTLVSAFSNQPEKIN